MRIVVLVKHVPDAASAIGFGADLTTERLAADCRLSELDEYAVEQALRLVEQQEDGEITYLTMGPDAAVEALSKALSMGGDAGVHVLDSALHGSDALATASVLAEALRRLDWDLIITGMASTDGMMGVVPALLAELLDVPALTMAGQLVVAGSAVTIERDTDEASMTVRASLPALVSVTDQTGEARYPSFKGIMAAKKKPIRTYSLADLDVDAAAVGWAAAASSVQTATRRPPRQAGTVIADEGDGGRQLAGFLSNGGFI